MNVVEIGCGETAGPFFEGADNHFIIEPDAVKLAKAAAEDTSFSPVQIGAEELNVFGDASIDLVLARNVFGYNALGLSEERGWRLIEPNSKLTKTERAQVQGLKLAILGEVERILVPSGKLVIVEQYTPRYAASLIRTVNRGTLGVPATLTPIIEVPLADVTPANYRDHHQVLTDSDIRMPARTWVAQKSNA